MAPVYKFAIIQLQPVDLAVADNFSRAASYIRSAASQGAHLAVLPEYHLTSWCPSHPGFVSACAESATYLSKYQDLARELNINIVPGTICEVHPVVGSDTPTGDELEGGVGIEKGKAEDGKGGEGVEVRNMAYWIAAGTGHIVGVYQKKNLWHSERPHLAPGKHAPHRAFDVPGLRMPASPPPPPPTSPSSCSCSKEGAADDDRPLRAGLLVCWDLAFPEAFRALIADGGGADVVVVPSFWHLTDVDAAAREINPQCERAFLEAAAVCRAFENTCCVVFCNTGGASGVALPIVGFVKEGGEEEGKEGDGVIGMGREEMRVLDVDLGVLRVAEDNYKVRRDIRGEGWHYGYELRRV